MSARAPWIAGRLGLWLALVSATLLRSFWTLPDGATGQALALLATAALLLAAPPAPERRPLWRTAALLAALAALAWAHPAPWWPALGALGLGVLLEPLPTEPLRRLAAGLRRAGAALYAGLWLVPLGSALQATFDADRPVGWLAERLGHWLGLQVGAVANTLVLQTPDEALPFSLAPEWTGFWPRWLALGVLLVALWRSRPAGRRGPWTLLPPVALFLGLAWSWSALVFLAQSGLAALHAQYEAPWSPLLQIALGLPVAALAATLAGPPRPAAPAAPVPARRDALAWAFSLGAWALLLAAIALPDPGVRKPGRVVVDDGHSDWEWAGEPMNSWQFGTKTTYNYHGLGRLLARHYDATILSGPITAALLDTTDVLVLKTPTRAYTADEKAAVIAWVERGGGLYLISDHTDVFGMSTYLNELAGEFGFVYNKDTVFDLNSTGDQFWPGPDGPLHHPVVEHLPFYRYLTGCSIRPGWGSRVAMSGPQTGSDLLSYATSNFFDTWYPRTELRFGSLVQLVVVEHGRGRVVGFSDSTTYSNFAMFLPGRLEHLIGIVEWLNHRSSGLPWRALLWLSALGLALLARRRGAGARHQLGALACAWALVLPLARQATALAAPWPEVRRVLPCASFDTALSQAHLPVVDALEADDPLDFETFYVWLYRSGRVPVLSADGPPPGSEVHAVIDPVRLPTAVEMAKMDAFLKGGGTLLVAGAPGFIVSGVNGWLDRYGAGFVAESRRSAEVRAAGEQRAVYVDAVQGVKGGAVLYETVDGLPAAVEVPVGDGRLIVSGLASCFATGRLGRYDSVPSELAYEYLHMYYRHVDIQAAPRAIEAQSDRRALP